jgi:hypothetical protein
MNLQFRMVPSLIALLAAAAVQATPRLPAEVRSDLALSYTPQCSLCHLRGNTGAGTEQTPFVLSARALGFDGNQRTLGTVLQQMQALKIDSDSDGVSDIEELIRGTDPNVYGPVPFSTETDPSYGCTSIGVAGLGGLLALGVVLRKRRRSHRNDARI